MTHAECRHCKAHVHVQAVYCPICGAAVVRHDRWIWVSMAAAAFMLLAWGVGGRSAAPLGRGEARAAIERCREDRQRAMTDPRVVPVAPGTCEEMARRYVERYGSAP